MGFEHDLDFSFLQFIKDVINCLPICYTPQITDLQRNSSGKYVDQGLDKQKWFYRNICWFFFLWWWFCEYQLFFWIKNWTRVLWENAKAFPVYVQHLNGVLLIY